MHRHLNSRVTWRSLESEAVFATLLCWEAGLAVFFPRSNYNISLLCNGQATLNPAQCLYD